MTLAFEFGLHKFQTLILGGKKGQKETGKFSKENLAIFEMEVFAVVGVVTSCSTQISENGAEREAGS